MTLIGNIHLIAGNAGAVAPLLLLLQLEGIQTSRNSDIYIRESSSFGIDEARELRSRASLRALNGRRVFIVVAAAMTTEAQNALLKTIEEAVGNTLFFFIVPAPHMLLPTIRSRAQILDLGRSVHVGLVDPKKFLNADPAQRLLLLKPLLEKGDTEGGRRDIGAVITFLSSLESTMEHVQAREIGLGSTRGEGLEAIYRARKYIGDKGALMKPLLEQVALLLPKM